MDPLLILCNKVFFFLVKRLIIVFIKKQSKKPMRKRSKIKKLKRTQSTFFTFHEIKTLIKGQTTYRQGDSMARIRYFQETED